MRKADWPEERRNWGLRSLSPFFSRRELLLAPVVLGAAARIDYRDYSRVLPDYLRGLAARAYRKRNEEIAKLTTPGAIQARQQWARETFWKLAGGMPERTPLNPRITGSFERERYRVEKLVYESRPGFHISADLYIPKHGEPPYPAVLFQMGHSLNGKAAETYQRCCQGLVQLGFLVLAFDPMGQGERTYYPGAKGLTRLGSADAEHTAPGRQMLLVGDTATGLQVWDAVRSLDYLASHPLADPARLASTGQSGGGTLTMLLAAVDDRLAAAAVSSGNTENVACAEFNPPGSTDDAEQNLIGSGPLGFDRWDVLYPLAPKPLLILASAKDFFGTYSPKYLRDGREEFQKLKKVYEVLGHAEKLEWEETALPHALSLELRLRIYAWFRRWLRGETGLVEEPPTALEKDEALWAGPTGNVVRDFGSHTPFGMNRAKAAGMATPDRPPDVRALLGIEPGAGWMRRLGSARAPHGTIDAVEVETEAGVWVPAWLILPRQADPARPLLVVVEPQGRNSRLGESALYQGLAARGTIVCAADVRGIGDLRPEYGRGAAHYTGSHQNEENYAWASLILGRSLLAQRVTDLAGVVAALRADAIGRDRRVVVAASGTMTAPALFAAAIEARIDGLYLAGGLVSFRSIVEIEEYRHPFANFLPGVLPRADLPQLAASLAPRKVTLAGAVDAAGKPVAPEEVRKAYGRATNVDVLGEDKWDIETLVRL